MTARVLATIKRQRERFAGGVIAALGAAAVAIASGYPIGSLAAMGPGLFPLILGVIMVVLGVMIAAAGPDAAADPHEPDGLEHPEVRGWLCILGGVASFILLAKSAGLFPATFACVFIAAMGDRTATWRGSAVLATVVAGAGVALFYYGLRIQLPPFAFAA